MSSRRAPYRFRSRSVSGCSSCQSRVPAALSGAVDEQPRQQAPVRQAADRGTGCRPPRAAPSDGPTAGRPGRMVAPSPLRTRRIGLPSQASDSPAAVFNLLSSRHAVAADELAALGGENPKARLPDREQLAQVPRRSAPGRSASAQAAAAAPGQAPPAPSDRGPVALAGFGSPPPVPYPKRPCRWRRQASRGRGSPAAPPRASRPAIGLAGRIRSCVRRWPRR